MYPEAGLLIPVANIEPFRGMGNKSSNSFLCFPGGSVVKNLPANVGDTGSIPGLGKSPGEGNGNPVLNCCLGNPMDRVGWWVAVHGVSKESDTI